MHDNQHIVRLFLLDQGLKQGYLYPRWVDGLGFGFGYPLFNFYPPLVYYVGELFHLAGFSLIWSVKLTFILGFYIGVIGIYLLVKKLTNRLSAFLSATLYTFFFYHTVLIYVRGALAEFISLAILPLVFLTLYNLQEKPSLKRSILLGITLALLILTHPLIALPSFIFIGFFFLFYFFQIQKKKEFIKYAILGGLIGLSLSAFFWLPSFLERKYTLVDKILTSELASYKLHYIYSQQFIYSPWGYGGSGVGLSDGMTFQLGKIHIGLVFGSILLSIFYYFSLSFRALRLRSGQAPSRNLIQAHVREISPRAEFTSSFVERLGRNDIRYFYFFVFLLFFSLFMTTEYSSFIWDRIKFLWYLQFPWRFLTFVAIFISIVGGYCVFFLSRLLEQYFQPRVLKVLFWRSVYYFSVIVLIFGTIFVYQKYFKPQKFIKTTDKERTSYEEIAWRISRTSYEFVPKEVKTKKSELNTTLLAVEKKDLPKKSYEILSGEGNVTILNNKFQDKEFLIDAVSPLTFRLNTYYFPGWQTYINNKKINIDDSNDFKLITVSIPSGKQTIKFVFQDTNVRKVGNIISLVTFVFFTWILFYKLKKVD